MATFTDNHDFGRPTEGGDTDDWGRILNEDLIDLLEERVVVTDTAANRSTYTPYVNAVFIATDTGQIALGDGSAWNDLNIEPVDHASTHEDGGSDELSVFNLAGTLAGQGLEVVSDSLQILSSIWDGSDLVADVSNTLVDTTEVQNQDYNESITTHATASGTVTLDLAASNVHRVEATGDITLELSNVTSTPPGNSVLVKLLDDDGSGPHSITYGTSWNTILWDGGTVRDEIPASGNMRLSFESDDGGVNWWGIRSGSGFA